MRRKRDAMKGWTGTLDGQGKRLREQPIAEVDIRISESGRIDARIDDVVLAPIPAISDLEAVCRQLEEELGRFPLAGNASGTLFVDHEAIEQSIGRKLKRLLIGGVRSSGSTEGNPLELELNRLRALARADESFVAITLDVRAARMNRYPWSLCSWPSERKPLGVDEYVALSSRAVLHEIGDSPCRWMRSRRGATTLLVEHLSSDIPSEKHAAMVRTLGMLSTSLKEQWASGVDMVFRCYQSQEYEPSEHAQSLRVFQFMGHGHHEGGVQWLAPGERRNQQALLAGEFLRRAGGEQSPLLFVVLTCASADTRYGDFASALVRHGAAAAVGVLGELETKAPTAEFAARFYAFLARHGRIDRAVQAARRSMRYVEHRLAMEPQGTAPANWFRMVLVARSAAILALAASAVRGQRRIHRGPLHRRHARLLDNLALIFGIWLPSKGEPPEQFADVIEQHLTGWQSDSVRQLDDAVIKLRDEIRSLRQMSASPGQCGLVIEDIRSQVLKLRWETEAAASALGLPEQMIRSKIDGDSTQPE